MSSGRSLGSAAYLALKAAVRQMVKLAGGVEHAGSATRVGKSQLAAYGAVEHDDSYMPADVIADLEADVGEPLVTRELARLAGYELAACVTVAGPASARLECRMLDIVTGIGGLSGEVAAATADGQLTYAERIRIEDKALQARAVLNSFIDEIQRDRLAGRP